jgi:hypothetical protein
MPSFCFLTHIHDLKSFKLVQQNAIGWHYYNPQAQLIVISDGYNDAQLDTFNTDFFDFLCYYQSVKIKEPLYFAWLRRAFNVFLEYSNSDYMIRLDPDTVCHRPIETFPKADMFGTKYAGKLPHIQGGCIGFSRKLATEFITKSIKESNVRPVDNQNEHYSDLVLYDIVKNQLDLPIANWKEVRCHPTTLPTWSWADYGTEPYAFTHPHKELDN